MRNTVNILGVNVDNLNMNQAVDKVKFFLTENKLHTIYTPNAEIMMAAQRQSELKKILCEADMLVADGAGVVLASKILSLNLSERVAGFDLTNNIFKIKQNKKLRFFFFGGKPGVSETASKNVLRKYPYIEIAGCMHGYFEAKDTETIISMINNSNADVLLVALGAPRQEMWIHEHKHKLKVKVCIGVGGTFDILAGISTRAPLFFQKNGLEWFYRLCKEPWRFIRMLDLPKFILLVAAKKIMPWYNK